ncbi:MAG: cysteine desulfurase-like protein [Steroidobacteraceae bacterium]|jgi:cysteine desulfurase family protein (TIGR01976 family)|nr:cysteine desulfurase-like protein [Steroidobacteraceae bacterium]
MTRRWNEDAVRAAFPSLAIRDEGVPRLYLDAPAGTQVAGRAIERVRRAMLEACANDGGAFRTSLAADALMVEAHEAAAALLGAGSRDEIVFGLNMTSLAFSFAYMLSREWQAGDEIVLTRMDHDANVGPWLTMAEERGVTVRWLEFDRESFRYRYDTLGDLVGPRTKLVACNHASNLLGTVNDVARICAAGRAAGAVTVVDAVQSTPHIPVDAQAIGCDLLLCSAYKFFGPHAGLLRIRPELRDRLKPLKLRPSSNAMPTRFAPGTPSFEAQSGTTGAIEHMAWLGSEFGGALPDAPLRDRIVAGLAAATDHERGLMRRLLDGVRDIPGMEIFGISDPDALAERVPTFSLRLPGRDSRAVAESLAARNIFVWSGTFYAYEAAGVLGLRGGSGLVRVGLSHYTTSDEVGQVTRALAEIARG